MAFKFNRSNKEPMSEINVTPFVDVMLVLLIIFMVTAPLLTVGVKVDLPKTKASQLSQKGDPLVISVKKNGTVYIQDRKIEISKIIPQVKAISENNKNIRIFVKGDKNANYGSVLNVLARIKSAGYSKATLVAKLKN
jgi:biopolymer transport protein TolR